LPAYCLLLPIGSAWVWHSPRARASLFNLVCTYELYSGCYTICHIIASACSVLTGSYKHSSLLTQTAHRTCKHSSFTQKGTGSSRKGDVQSSRVGTVIMTVNLIKFAHHSSYLLTFASSLSLLSFLFVFGVLRSTVESVL
jgi:hypothetical protein